MAAEADDTDGYTNGRNATGDDARNALAEDRTDMAEDRTIMAVERTFAGWIRTAFGAIGIGLAFRVLFGELDPPWLARVIATVFILLAVWLPLTAERRASRSLERMHNHVVDRPDLPVLRWIAWAVSGAAALLIAGLWVMNDGTIPTG